MPTYNPLFDTQRAKRKGRSDENLPALNDALRRPLACSVRFTRATTSEETGSRPAARACGRRLEKYHRQRVRTAAARVCCGALQLAGARCDDIGAARQDRARVHGVVGHAEPESSR